MSFGGNWGNPPLLGFCWGQKSKGRSKDRHIIPCLMTVTQDRLIYKYACLMGKSIFRCEQELPQTPNTAGLRNFRLHKELAALGETTITSVSRLMKIWANKTYNPTPDVSFCLLYCDITFQRPTLPQTRASLLDSFGRDFERLKSMSKNRLACGDATARWRCKCAYRMPSVRGSL